MSPKWTKSARTGRENDYVNGSVLWLSRREIDQQFENMVGFAELADAINFLVPNLRLHDGQYRLSFFVMHEVVGTEHVAQDLHFDVQKTLKFFLYLNDVTAENGAFTCVPGSHRHTESVRLKLGDQVSYENRHLTRDHPYTEDDTLDVEGPAGTLIIFTTEVWHRAGKVSKGERKVMPGHTRQRKPNKKPKTADLARSGWLSGLKLIVGR